MEKYALERARVVLFNPSGRMRATLRDALLSLGFREIVDSGDLDRARAVIGEGTADLVLLDLDRHRDEVCRLVRDIRHNRVSANPFVVIIALSWEPSSAAVNSTMEAGVDDIVTMPVSVKLLSDRLDQLIHRRRPFAVTASYVGPDRRGGARTAEDELGLGTIAVPNGLRFKAVGDAAAAPSAEAVKSVQAQVDHHRINRYAQRIGWLADRSKADPDGPSAPRLEEIGELIGRLGAELSRRRHGRLLEICESMARVVALLRTTPNRRLCELLRVQAMAVTATLLGRDEAAELVVEALKDATRRLRPTPTGRQPAPPQGP